MRHQHHRVLRANRKLTAPTIRQCDDPLACGNRSACASCARPSATVTASPAGAAISTTGLASSPAPNTNSRLRRPQPLHKPPLVSLSRLKPSRTLDLLRPQARACKDHLPGLVHESAAATIVPHPAGSVTTVDSLPSSEPP